MTVPSQTYAGLSSDSYDFMRQAGVRPHGKEENVVIDGVTFSVKEHYDNPKTGYQGTIYQRNDTGEIIVAHRGTEFNREPFKDGVIADAGMVLTRTNAQAPEATALTQRAIDMAKNFGERSGKQAPEVTVTGHSLGGTLAQITAHEFNLRGEAFNPYGAAGLNHGVPEGGHRFVNHVMAGDTVSAASPHYGQVRMYAKSSEVIAVTAAGYGRFNLIPNQPLAASVLTMYRAGSHNMDNFLDVDSKKNPDVSVLKDLASQQLAKEHAWAFGEYRLDVRVIREGLSAPAAIMQILTPAKSSAVGETTPSMMDELYRHRKTDGMGQPAPSSPDKADSLPNYLRPVRTPLLGEASALRGQHAAGVETPSFRGNPQAFLDQMLDAANRGDHAGFRLMTQTAANDPFAQRMQAQSVDVVNQQEQQRFAQQQAEQQQQDQDQDQIQREATVVRGLRMG